VLFEEEGKTFYSHSLEKIYLNKYAEPTALFALLQSYQPGFLCDFLVGIMAIE